MSFHCEIQPSVVQPQSLVAATVKKWWKGEWVGVEMSPAAVEGVRAVSVVTCPCRVRGDVQGNRGRRSSKTREHIMEHVGVDAARRRVWG